MSGHNNEILKTLHQKFGVEFPIVEAPAPLRLQPKACDCEGADPKDPSNCILVHTAKRMFDAEAVIVWRTSAYALLPSTRKGEGIPFGDRPGRWRWERFIVRTDALQTLADFDRGKPFAEGTAVMFDPPPHHAKRDVKRRRAKAYHMTEIGMVRAKVTTAAHALKRAKAALEKSTSRSASPATSRSASPATSRSAAPAAVRERVKKLETTLAEATRKFEAVRRRTTKKHAPRTAVFDLTTRNGAKGNYHFIPLNKAA